MLRTDGYPCCSVTISSSSRRAFFLVPCKMYNSDYPAFNFGGGGGGRQEQQKKSKGMGEERRSRVTHTSMLNGLLQPRAGKSGRRQSPSAGQPFLSLLQTHRVSWF